MIYKFSVFSNTDIGLPPQDFGAGTYTVSGSPRSISVLDDDPILDDENGIENDGSLGLIDHNESWDSSKQTLQGDLDGLGVDGHVIQSVYVFNVVNHTTGESGKVYMLRVYDSTTPLAYGEGMSQVGPYYYAFTMPISDGDEVTFTGGEYIGQVAYSDLVDLNDGENPPVCFLAGTLIATPRGEVAVESLNPGDEVVTRDGLARVRWLGAQRISLARQRADERLCPIRIAAGALGYGLPERDLFVSQQHRILIPSPATQAQPFTALHDSQKVLVAACHLIGLPGISRCQPEKAVIYVHFLCDRHEVIFAHGAPAETLMLGPEALKSLSPAALEELDLLLPGGLSLLNDEEMLAPAAPILSGRDARHLLHSHKKRGARPLPAARHCPALPLAG